jgi:hypothetical protein
MGAGDKLLRTLIRASGTFSRSERGSLLRQLFPERRESLFEHLP